MSKLTKNQLKLRVSKLSDDQIINVLDCKKQLNLAIKMNPLAKWRNILIDTLIHKVLTFEINEMELITLENENKNKMKAINFTTLAKVLVYSSIILLGALVIYDAILNGSNL